MGFADVVVTLEELGALQWGLVTTGQAENYGISRVTLGRLRDDDVIHQVRRGVWALPSADHGPLQGLRAAWLSTRSRELASERLHGDDEVVVSHVSAAAVHSLGNLIPQRYEFTSERRRQTSQADLRFHRAAVTGDVHVVDGLPVTSIPRTVEDIAKGGADLDHLGSIIRDSLAAPDVAMEDLADRLDAVAVRHGYDDGAALVEDSLDRTGLPSVASNLAGSRAMARAVAGQIPSALSKEVLEEIQRSFITPELVDTIARAMGSSAVVETRAHAAVQAALAPVREHYVQALPPAMAALRQALEMVEEREGESPGAEDVAADDDVMEGDHK